jgi:hypothetical protein
MREVGLKESDAILGAMQLSGPASAAFQLPPAWIGGIFNMAAARWPIM